ncbi:IS1595 family transposase ISCco3 [subsurface metagenome]
MGTKQFTCIYANEWDKYACQIYRKNFGEGELYEGDITKVSAKSIPDFDFLTAGFPCPSYSIAGKRKGFKDPRGALFFEICRIAKVKKPALLLLENVDGLLNHENGETFQIILDSLSELGYDCEWEVLNSKNFGVPQNRKRVFIVGHLRGTSGQKVFPLGGNCEKNISKNKIREIHPIFKETERLSDAFRIRDTEGNSATLKGLGGGLGAKTGLYAISPTLYGFKHGTHKHFNEILPKQLGLIRRLTPIECERLQGFPDGWTEGISDSQRYKCLGNAVTVDVIVEIGRKLIDD